MDSRSHTRELGVSLLFTQDTREIDSLQCDVESTLELDYEGTNIPIGLSGPYFELVYLVGMGYEGQTDFKFTFVHKNILIIT